MKGNGARLYAKKKKRNEKEGIFDSRKEKKKYGKGLSVVKEYKVNMILVKEENKVK